MSKSIGTFSSKLCQKGVGTFSNKQRVSTSINLKLSYLMMFVSIFIPIFILYGVIDDFIFQHIGCIQKYSIQGWIPNTENVIFSGANLGISGFYTYGIIISKLCGFNYDILPFLPLNLVTFVILLFSLLRYFSDSILLCSFITFIITTFTTNLSYINFHPHGMGLMIFFLIIILILQRQQKINCSNIFSFLILLSIISVNFISYKATFWVLSVLFMLLILEMWSNRRRKSIKYIQLNNIFIFAIIIVFSFNSFIYDTALPVLRFYSDTDADNGIYKVLYQLLQLKIDQSDMLYNCGVYYSCPHINSYIIIVREMLIGVFALIAIIIISINMINDTYDYNDIIFLSLISAGFINIVVYNLMGLFDIKLVTFLSVISFLVLYKHNMLKTPVIIVVYILIAMNLIYLVNSVVCNDVQGDNNYFSYIRPSVNWYKKFEYSDSVLKTDVLTKGYYIKELSRDEQVPYPTHFRPTDILLIIQKSSDESTQSSMYLVNYKLSHFSITGWKILKSFKYFKSYIDSNVILDKVYTSSEYISIYISYG